MRIRRSYKKKSVCLLSFLFFRISLPFCLSSYISFSLWPRSDNLRLRIWIEPFPGIPRVLISPLCAAGGAGTGNEGLEEGCKMGLWGMNRLNIKPNISREEQAQRRA